MLRFYSVSCRNFNFNLYYKLEYFWGGSDEGYAAYLIQSWNSLSQIAVACLTTLLLWFMPVASKVICVTVLGWGDWPAIWVQVRNKIPAVRLAQEQC